MAKRFEEMSPDVQATVLRVLESVLTALPLNEAGETVDKIVSAFGRLYPEKQTSVGEIVVNVRVEAESK